MDQQDNKIGQVRFYKDGRQSEISISLHEKYREQGYGTNSIKQSSNKALSSSGIKKIVAKIKKDNVVSIKAFKKAGYKLSNNDSTNNPEIVELIYESD